MSLPGAQGSASMTNQFVLSDRLVHPDAYGGEMLLAKMQAPDRGPAGPGSYHNLRSAHDVRGVPQRGQGPQGLQRVRGGDAGAQGYIAVVMHRWAKRTDDWELTVCLDREPTTDVKW